MVSRDPLLRESAMDVLPTTHLHRPLERHGLRAGGGRVRHHLQGVDVINFAQGEFLLLGAYLAFAFIAQIGLPWSLGVAATLVTALAIGLVVERFVLRPLIGEPIISMIMVTIGLSSVLKALVHAIWGAAPRSFPGFLASEPIHARRGGDRPPAHHRLVGASARPSFTLFFRYTRDGIAMRAIADDQQAALSMGISIKRVLAVAWAMSAAAAAVGGIMVANWWAVATTSASSACASSRW